MIQQTFTKKDLRTGMLVETRNGDIAMVLLGTANGDIISGGTWADLEEYSDDLLKSSFEEEGDITKVYQPIYNPDYLEYGISKELANLVWERPVEKTKEQIEREAIQAKIAIAQKALREAQVLLIQDKIVLYGQKKSAL